MIGGMSRRRPKYTTKSPGKGKALKASPAAAEGLRVRRKPRKMDYVAAAVALLIIFAMVFSAIFPYLFR
jgi:hypothetical protein